MNPRMRSLKSPVTAEALLPLLLFSNSTIFYAAAIFPVLAGITLFFLELLREKLAPRSRAAFFMFWLALAGSAGWLYLHIPAYWIWSSYLLIPAVMWESLPAVKKRPWLTGVKKYARRRSREFLFILAAAFLTAFIVCRLREYLPVTGVWLVSLGILLVAQTFYAQFCKRTQP